jgi:GAF domain-containing protein/AAA+ ATPase superfamily predicted ATPase
MAAPRPSAQKCSADIQCHFLRTISTEMGRDEMLQYIVEQVQVILEASACSIYIVDEDGKTATMRAGEGYQRSFIGVAKCDVVPENQVEKDPESENRLGITGWILSTGKSFLACKPEEVVNHPHRLGLHDPDMSPDRKLRLQTFLGVPIRGLHGEIIGAIKAERRYDPVLATQPFSVEEQIILETVARVTSRSLSYLETAHDRSVDSAITAWARDVITEVSISEGDLDGFLSLVVTVVAAAMHADSCGIFLTDPRKNTLTQRAGTGSQKQRLIIRSYKLPKKEDILEQPSTYDERVGLTAWIAATGESFCARNFKELHDHPHHRGEFDPQNFVVGQQICGAFLGVPLQVAGEIHGTLKVENISIVGEPDLREFDEGARRRFDVLAQDIALAKVRLEEHATDPYQVIMNAQQTIFQILHGAQDVQTLVNIVVNKTMALLKARACGLFLKEGDLLVQPKWAAAGYFSTESPGRHRREYKLVKPEEILDSPKEENKVGLTVWIAVKREKFTARSNLELRQHPHHLGTFDPYNFDRTKGETCFSFMGVPLIVGRELVGVLKVESKQKIGEDGNPEYTYFSQQDELVFDLIANSVAIAIENAKLSESRRFAEQILAQPNRLLLDLHEFAKNNPQTVETLTQVSYLISGKKGNIATIVQHYAALTQPDFPLYSLESIPELMKNFGDFLEGGRAMEQLYTWFHEALNITSVGGLARFCSRSQVVLEAQIGQAQFFLTEPAALFIELIQQMNRDLQGDSLTRSILDSARLHLEAARTRAAVLVPPEQGILLRIIDLWKTIVLDAKDAFKRVENPYNSGLPVQPLKSPFFGRRDIFEWISYKLLGATQNNILVFHGERRMGKTSILLQLLEGDLGKELRENETRPILPVHIDLQNFNDWQTAKFLYKLCQLIQSKVVRRYEALAGQIDVPPFEAFEQMPFGIFEQFITTACSHLDKTVLVLMFDEFERLDEMVSEGLLDRKIFTQLRSLMQFTPNLTFILAGSHNLDEMSADYRNLAQSIALIREVSFMDKEDSLALIRQPVAGQVSYDDTAVEELWRYTHGHPYLIQYLCGELITEMNQRGEGNYIAAGHVTKVIERFLAGQKTHLDNLWDACSEMEKAVLYALAESEETLQGGVTQFALREKISRLSENDISGTLARLVKRGLVESSPAPEPGANPVFSHTILLFSKWVYRNAPKDPAWQ